MTDAEGAALLDGLDTGVPADRVLRVDDPGYADRVAAHAGADAADVVAARCRPRGGRSLPAPLHLGHHRARRRRSGAPRGGWRRSPSGRPRPTGTTATTWPTAPCPSSTATRSMVLWGPTLAVGATVALARRFSASGFLPDVRRYGVTTFTYVGKALAYVLATDAVRRRRRLHPPPRLRHGGVGGGPGRLPGAVRLRPDRGLRLERGRGGHQAGPGNAGRVARPALRGRRGGRPGDRAASARRPSSTPSGALRQRRRGSRRRSSTAPGPGGSRATTTTPRPPPQRLRDGWYWTGDLAYRDADGWFWFAGRGGDWLRVDSENLTAGPIERVLVRFPDVAAVAVYPVPDPRSGDQVMAALELLPGADVRPGGVRRVPGGPGRPRHQVGARLPAGDQGAAPDGERQGDQGVAAPTRAGGGPTTPSTGAVPDRPRGRRPTRP